MMNKKVQKAHLTSRIKLYPDGMDLTSMLYGTEQQAAEDTLGIAYWSILCEGGSYGKEPFRYLDSHSFYWSYFALDFVLERKLPGMRFKHLL
jgi:hypothetical protein